VDGMRKTANILLVTVTDVESKAVLKAFKGDKKKVTKLVTINERSFHDLGILGGYRIHMLQSQMGAVNIGGSLQSVEKGIQAISPKFVIMVGIAFGVYPEKQKIGDVLVSSKLALYEAQRVGSDKHTTKKKLVLRSDKPSSSTRLFNVAQAAMQYWKGAEIRLGAILSGEKLVDNKKFRQELLDLAPDAIGGEMEGAGLYAACQEGKTDWILIKAISDWADGNKDKNRDKNQNLAARNAASFTRQLIKNINVGKRKPRKIKAKLEKKTQTRVDKIPFVNRKDEIKDITSLSNITHYFLVSAPIGYGKSELMSEVFERFDKGEWSRAYIKTDGDTTIKEISHRIATQLGVSLKNDSISWGLRLGSSWKTKFEKDSKGLVLLLDLDKEPPTGILSELLDGFVVDIHNSLRTLKSFENRQRNFRVVIAGRQLTSLKEFKDSINFSSWKAINLSPFTFDVVRLSASMYLEESETSESIDQVAAHTLYLTGGHPHCVAETLKKYKEDKVSPDSFVENRKEELWRTTFRNTIDEIKSHLLSNLRIPLEVLETISVFRFLDDDAVQCIYKKHKKVLESNGIRDHFQFQDTLTESFYFSYEQNEPWVISDTIARMLISISLRHEKNKSYLECCEYAIKVCEERIKKEQRPYRWIVEYLFQSLQKETGMVNQVCERRALREKFVNVLLPNAMDLFFSTHTSRNHEMIREKELMRKEMSNKDRHWEFHFLVNYFLREDQYLDSTFDHMIKNNSLWRR
jgi:nucleoside phosphorylase